MSVSTQVLMKKTIQKDRASSINIHRRLHGRVTLLLLGATSSLLLTLIIAVVVKASGSIIIKGMFLFGKDARTQVDHPNIIPLMGYCDNKLEPMIVYSYMSIGHSVIIFTERTGNLFFHGKSGLKCALVQHED